MARTSSPASALGHRSVSATATIFRRAANDNHLPPVPALPVGRMAPTRFARPLPLWTRPELPRRRHRWSTGQVLLLVPFLAALLAVLVWLCAS